MPSMRSSPPRSFSTRSAGFTPPHRDVIALVYYRGYSVAQAAQALGVPPGTVKSRSYYALRALRDTLRAKGITHP